VQCALYLHNLDVPESGVVEGSRRATDANDGDEKEGARRGASDTLTSMNNLAFTLKSGFR